MRSIPLLLAAFCIPPLAMADAVVTFNELNYNPPDSQDGEWIELHNQMAVNVDISGWRLADGIAFTFAQGTVIPGGGFLVVAKDPAHFTLAGLSGVLGPYNGNLSNSGEAVELRGRSGRLMDRIEYGDAGEWPIAPDGTGATLAKRHPGLSSADPANWTASRVSGGNPGSRNFAPPAAPIPHVFVHSGSEWRFDDSNTPPPSSWTESAFNDAAWATGSPLFGTASATPALAVIQNLVARYRAGDVTGVANGAAFSPWIDTSTGDGVAQNAIAGGDPRYQSAVTLSAQPVVRFDGNDEFRTTVSPGIAPSSGFVYFVVCRANAVPASGTVTDGAGAYLFDRNTSANGTPLVSLKAVSSNRYGFQKRDDGKSGLGGPVSTSQISTTKFQIVAVRRNPAQSRFEIWVDGVLEGSTPDEGDNFTPQPIVIGRHATNVNGGFNGDIAELLIYQNALTDVEFQSVGTYLEARYGLTTAFPDTTVTTPLAAGTTTSYLRKSFNFDGDPARTLLRLDHTVSDGAVFHLNGREIARVNLADGPVGHGTPALVDLPQPMASGFLPIENSPLVAGENVLAVSLHKAAGDDSAFFSARLEATESPADPAGTGVLSLNEIGSTIAPPDGFFIELRNLTSGPVPTSGYSITAPGGHAYFLPILTIPPGGLVNYAESELGFRPAPGAKVVLRGPGAIIADAQLTATSPGGRDDAWPDHWLKSSTPTPGAENQFQLASDVVIHEICYKAPNLPPIPGTPPVSGPIPLLSHSSTWRYNQSGADLGAGWAATSHPLGGAWQSGQSPLGFSNNTLPLALATRLVAPLLNTPYVVTTYFETDFMLSNQQADSLVSLNLTYMIDDGAVFYLNGVELLRFNMPAGAITAQIFSSAVVGNAALVGPVTVAVPPGTAIAGSNRLSVEVHQQSANSSDIAFSLAASATVVTNPGTPDVPATPSPQQWLELHNRGAAAVNLSGWQFTAGIAYAFPAGTVMEPGDHLVLAKDPSLVAAATGTTVLGPFSGNLSAKGEKLLLVDALGNPADEVSYVDGGRWPSSPDGGGSTLELRDPRADNSLPESWAGSNEGHRRSWQTFTYQGVAAPSAVGPDNQWREFVFGLLDGGEILIDDISVTDLTNSAQLISNGNFQSGSTGWRFLGNHGDAQVVLDPDDVSNQVLHLRATGASEHMHNHVETTLAGGLSVINGRSYQISFRVRWLSGCNLLNTRLYFNRLARTSVLDRPQILGTPGQANSTTVTNLGPGFTRFSHFPVMPEPGEPVVVSASVEDPDGIGGLTLSYSHAGGAYQNIAMSPAEGVGEFIATIPGFGAASVVRFHVAASDSAVPPATSFFPAAGPASHALYQVNDGLAANNGLHNIRIVMDPADKADLYRTNNLMSNGRIGCTVIYGESEVFYNVGVRLKSSQRGRQNAARVGFNLGFNNDQLFRGVHRTIAIDRSEGQITGAQEILYDHMIYASGGIPAECNDLVRVIAPDPAHTSSAILQLARFGSVYLHSEFENGADGTVYEYELIYYPTTADANGYKLPQPDSVLGIGVTHMGDDKENYRWTYLTKNSEEKDDYSRVMAMTKLFDKSGAAFEAEVDGVLDIDQWLRALAYSCASGAGDSFFANSRHNGQFYARPSDGRMLYFSHDMDFSFSATRPIFTNTELQKLTANPARRRAYLGHLHDVCSTVFNQSYMSAWTSHYGSLLPNENFSGHLNYINTRSNYILNAINSDVPPLAFDITTNGGLDFSTQDTPVTLSGRAWVNVREIRLAGSSVPLTVNWIDSSTWQILVPVAGGASAIHLEALDFSGQIVGTDSITVTYTGGLQVPGPDNMVVSEIYYNPLLADDLSEFIELMNISPTATIDLGGLAFTQGIVFSFPADARLDPGARVVLVRNLEAFTGEFGVGRPVAGTFTGALDNAGETLTLRRVDNTVVRSFAYGDDPPWPTIADTAGHSIVLVDPYSNPDHSDPLSWRASLMAGGEPGGTDVLDYADWKSAHGNPADDLDGDGDGFSTRVEYVLGGNPLVADQSLGPTYVLEPGGTLLVSIRRRADAGGVTLAPQSSTTLEGAWQDVAGAAFISNQRLSGVPAMERLSFRIPSPPGSPSFFVRFAIR